MATPPRSSSSGTLAGKANPMRENVEPDDLAAAVLYLVGDASRHVTGQVLHVNAGVLMTS